MPLNAAPDPAGNIIMIRQPDGKIRARVLTGDELPAQQEAWMPHWSTCPDSSIYRAARRRATPRCIVCGQPMDPQLARTESWIKHPSCDATPPDRTRAGPTPRCRDDAQLF